MPEGGIIAAFRTRPTQETLAEFEALYAEHLIREGRTDSDLLPFDESIAIMATLDDIRAQLGVTYPKER